MKRLDSMNKTVEIIVPVYNIEAYLIRCVDSLLGQTHSDIRIWLVDDGSTDGCPEICDAYSTRDRRVRVIHKANGGLASARNEALARIFSQPVHERGGYVAFVDSDDWVEPDFVEFLLCLAGEADADIAQCGHWITYSDAREVEKSSDYRLHIFDRKGAVESILRNDVWDVTAWNKLYKANVFKELRFPEGTHYEDTAIAPRLACNARRMAVRMNPKYHYVQRYTSIANGVSWTDRKYDFLSVGDEVASFSVKLYPDLARAAMEKRVFVRLSTLAQMVNTGHYDAARIREMRQFVLANGGTVLLDPAASRRDKLGIIALFLGFRAFRTLWKINYSITRRRS